MVYLDIIEDNISMFWSQRLMTSKHWLPVLSNTLILSSIAIGRRYSIVFGCYFCLEALNNGASSVPIVSYIMELVT